MKPRAYHGAFVGSEVSASTVLEALLQAAAEHQSALKASYRLSLHFSGTPLPLFRHYLEPVVGIGLKGPDLRAKINLIVRLIKQTHSLLRPPRALPFVRSGFTR